MLILKRMQVTNMQWMNGEDIQRLHSGRSGFNNLHCFIYTHTVLVDLLFTGS